MVHGRHAGKACFGLRRAQALYSKEIGLIALRGRCFKFSLQGRISSILIRQDHTHGETQGFAPPPHTWRSKPVSKRDANVPFLFYYMKYKFVQWTTYCVYGVYESPMTIPEHKGGGAQWWRIILWHIRLYVTVYVWKGTFIYLSLGSVYKQNTALKNFESQWKEMELKLFPLPQ